MSTNYECFGKVLRGNCENLAKLVLPFDGEMKLLVSCFGGRFRSPSASGLCLLLRCGSLMRIKICRKLRLHL